MPYDNASNEFSIYNEGLAGTATVNVANTDPAYQLVITGIYATSSNTGTIEFVTVDINGSASGIQCRLQKTTNATATTLRPPEAISQSGMRVQIPAGEAAAIVAVSFLGGATTVRLTVTGFRRKVA